MSETMDKPPDHFPELLYTIIIIIFLIFVLAMSHVHNDSLAAKGMEFVYIALGAMMQASTGGAKHV